MNCLKFEYRNLKSGDIVEFSDTFKDSRFAIVTSGFGMSLASIGTKIFGIFGATKEEAVENYKDHVNCLSKYTDVTERLNSQRKPYEGFVRRQLCKVVGKVDLKTGEEITVTK